jgi:hypothetical protein
MTHRIDSQQKGFTPAERVVAGALIVVIVVVIGVWLTGSKTRQATAPPASQPINVLDMEPVSDEGQMVNADAGGLAPTSFPATASTASSDAERWSLPSD